MGRYISGDIEDKLGFACQDSDDLVDWGNGEDCTSSDSIVVFSREYFDEYKAKLEECFKELGHKYHLEDDELVCDDKGIEEIEVDNPKSIWYYRCRQMLKIIKYLKDNDTCQVTCEV